MSVRCSAVLVSLLLIGSSASADWILVPVSAAEPVPGAYGSLWSVRLTAYNGSQLWVRIDPPEECNLAPCEQKLLAPGETMEVSLGRTVPSALGEFFFISPSAESIHLYYRTRDESRRLETAGTMLPILRESDAPSGDLVLVGIPIEERFRVMLRLYGLTGPDALRITIFPMGGGSALASLNVQLIQAGAPTPTPAQAQVSDLGALLPGFQGEVRVLVEAGDGSSIWGFATVTHNETQHVTVVEAQ